jgi:2-keto-4-pentenoate hydratase
VLGAAAGYLRAVVAPGSNDATRAADRILDAFASQRLIPPLSRDDLSLDEDSAYAIALEVYNRRVRRGEKPVGRKIGFTNRSIWAEYRVSAPIWGHVYDSTVHYARNGEARLAVGHLLQPRIEAEIQLHFARTPPVTRDEHAILESIDWIAQGFEIVQCPFPDWDFAAVDLHRMTAFSQAAGTSRWDSESFESCPVGSTSLWASWHVREKATSWAVLARSQPVAVAPTAKPQHSTPRSGECTQRTP